jgi:hypothetical protein
VPSHPTQSSGPPQPSAPPAGLRGAVDRASLPLISGLARLPRAVPFLVLVGLLLVGLFRGGVLGAVCTGLVAVFVGWLLYLSWPRLTASERLGRAAVLLLALALFLVQLFPRG